MLNEAGQGGRRVNIKPAAKTPTDSNEHMQDTVAQMEGQGEYTMAGLLRVVAEGRATTLSAKKSRKKALNGAAF